MSTYPRDRDQFLVWAEAHVDLWLANATQIGLTNAQASEFKNTVGAMRESVTAQQIARDAAKSATMTAKVSENSTRGLTGDLVRTIRAFAIASNDPNVYALAQIPAPASKSPVPPPGQPFDFRVELNSTGSITLRWKANNPAGSANVVYFIQRRLVNQSNFSIVGAVGERAFTDETLPIGSDGAVYIVTPQRGGTQGQPSRQLLVAFGSGGPIGRTVSLREDDQDAQPVKMAA
ncbi:MAG: fibronectin type III domain-containing protein [Phycisphaeraceae bacterium]|nr:fibronectin type III domain-containing protein [Phycisphaeraceae bacterium]